MKAVWVAVAVSLTGATLVAGPIAYLRTQRQIGNPQPSFPADSYLPANTSPEAEGTRPVVNSVRVTGELIRAEQIKTPQPAAARVVTKAPERRRSVAPAKKSLFARVLFGSSGYRPSPFPRPGS